MAASRPSRSLPGLAFGSFLNVVAARVPLRRSIVRPGSACMSCGDADRVVRQHPARLVRAAARALPALPGRDLRGATRAVELTTAALDRRAACSASASPGRRGRRVLLRHARRDLGDRHRAARHPEPHRPAGRGRRARGATRCSTRRPSGSLAGLGACALPPRRRARLSRRAWAWATSSSPCCSASGSDGPFRSR